MPVQAITEKQLAGASAPPVLGIAAGPDSRHAGRKLLALVAATTCVYLYLQTFVLPAVPILQRDDQITFVVNAVRMLRGEMIYSDFYQYTPPGTDLVYLGLFKLFGVRAWIASAVVLLLGVATFWASYGIAARVMARSLACLTAALFTVFIFTSMNNATHHWYSALLIMCAVLTVLERRTSARLAGAGALVALASLFTQTRVLSLLVLAVFVAWEKQTRHGEWRDVWKRESSLLLGFAVAFLLSNLYFLRHAGLERMFRSQVVALSHSAFTFKYYLLGAPSVPPWSLSGRLAGFIMVYLLVPAGYIYTFVWLARKRGQGYSVEDERLLLLSLIGAALCLEVLPAPNWVRLFPISMPAIILAMRYVAGEGKIQLVIRRSLWAATAAIALLCTVSAQARPHRVLDLPVGRTVVYDETISRKLEGLAARTKPGDFFFEAAWLELYFPLQLRNPSYVEALSPSLSEAQVQNVVKVLERRQVKYVLWSARLDRQGAKASRNDTLRPIRAYLKEHYHLVEHFAPTEDLWERTAKSTATPVSAEAFPMQSGRRDDSSAAPPDASSQPSHTGSVLK
jgi:hypothetical protein